MSKERWSFLSINPRTMGYTLPITLHSETTTPLIIEPQEMGLIYNVLRISVNSLQDIGFKVLCELKWDDLALYSLLIA